MRLGAHVSASGGLNKAIGRAQEIGVETIQMFASSPRGWAFKPQLEEDATAFRNEAKTVGISPVFLHGIYLVNVGGTVDLVEKSVNSLVNHMNVAGQIGAAGVIFHGGSHKGVGFDGVLGQAASALRLVLSQSPTDVWLIIENSAGMGSNIGGSFEEIARLIREIDSPQVMVCLDIQHCMASGYRIGDPTEIDAVMDHFDEVIGLPKLVVVHANDSKVKYGSGVDRHENIGQGYLGIEGFETIMGHSAFQNIPFILEVPGFDKRGPDRENLDRLKAIRSRLNVPI